MPVIDVSASLLPPIYRYGLISGDSPLAHNESHHKYIIIISLDSNGPGMAWVKWVRNDRTISSMDTDACQKAGLYETVYCLLCTLIIRNIYRT